MKNEKKITVVLFGIYMVLLTWIILFKMDFSWDWGCMRSVNLIPFRESVIVNGRLDVREILYNVIVFVPVGVYLMMVKPEWSFWRKAGMVFGISLFYEVMQFVLGIGASDITDLITNTSGGVLGIGMFVVLRKILKEKTVRVVNVLAGMCTVLLVGLIVVLLAVN